MATGDSFGLFDSRVSAQRPINSTRVRCCGRAVLRGSTSSAGGDCAVRAPPGNRHSSRGYFTAGEPHCTALDRMTPVRWRNGEKHSAHGRLPLDRLPSATMRCRPRSSKSGINGDSGDRGAESGHAGHHVGRRRARSGIPAEPSGYTDALTIRRLSRKARDGCIIAFAHLQETGDYQPFLHPRTTRVKHAPSVIMADRKALSQPVMVPILTPCSTHRQTVFFRTPAPVRTMPHAVPPSSR